MPTPSTLVGRILGHYRILEQIGAGGMGVVYRAHDERLDRDIALKVLPAGTLADESARRQFRREALALAKLNHPNVAAVYEFDNQDGLDFLVMELISGLTLDAKIAGKALPEKEALRLGIQLADALNSAHTQGIIHRDLKPGNLRVSADDWLKVLDFGLAQWIKPSEDGVTITANRSREVSGTVPYMAPEQLRGGKADPRSDIYSAGAVLYEMSTGQRPFTKSGPQLIGSILEELPLPPRALNQKVSPALEAIILKAVDKDPDRRYQSAKELRVDLERLSTGVTPVARTRTTGLRPIMVLAPLLIIGLLFALNVGGWRDRLLHGNPKNISSLVVLPLENLSGDAAQDYFADGMTEALIMDLSKIQQLRVISHTSVTQYKNTHKPVHQIGRELNVDAAVSGTVLRSGNHIRISVALADAANDRNLWAESYDEDLHDVMDLQNRVARAIANEIRVQLTPEEHESLTGTRTVSPQAYEAYLRGRYFWNKRTPDDLRRGIEYFQKATDIDPSYPSAYAGLADSYILLADEGELAPRDAMPRAKNAANKALQLDSSLAEAHVSIATIQWTYNWDWVAANREFDRALTLNPSYATAREWYGLYLTQTGQFDQAIAQMQRAQQLDPLSLVIEANVGRCYYYARRYDKAVELLQHLEDREPNFWIVHSILGQTYLVMGRLDDAIRELELARTLLPDAPRNLGILGDAYGRSGRRSESLKLAAELEQLSHKRYVAPVFAAMIQMGLRDKSQAMTLLEKTYNERSDWVPQLKTDPEFDLLRDDPRFTDLLRRVDQAPQTGRSRTKTGEQISDSGLLPALSMTY